MNTIPERVAWLRVATALSKRGLSKLAGLDPSHVRLIEASGGRRIEQRTLEALAGVFGVELAWLMLGAGPCLGRAPSLRPEAEEDREAITALLSEAVAAARKSAGADTITDAEVA